MTPTDRARATHETLAHLPAQLDWQHGLYRHFHAHPELSYAEHATATRIEEELTGLGLTPRRIAGTGVLVTLTNGDGPTVLARADTDALPVTEDTGLDYTSTNPGVMHACAHDMHITALLGTVRLLHENRGTWAGTLTALFQPAEELNNGAQTVVDDGLAAAIPAPDVALAQHILPTRAGAVGIAPGPVLSAADSLKVTILGRATEAMTVAVMSYLGV